ncbi:SUMF1/EgtB/PvdO family nonheme iron enzyme [uncultured Methanomethylovorans sp.]|uniref:SUMF1/EgtB/PvdO family nonheme iron enzyme n=1 Tax=uncultured Methanomethylovorans sp. TaxID=183759 RepID=UPI002AA7E18E|nr:SUMF1/EgtB/PvdO family nonheme iron enzyme [uncultured Methanomethylovorans sp.]
MHPLTITRTVYDPATRDFIFYSAESKALPNIRQWINNNNPVIYWYILRVDNHSELSFDQWAIELYTHQALNITEAYIDGIDRRFKLKKSELDSWNEKNVLSISKQLGIPIVGKGTRRIFFKVDINCEEALMHEYGISGRFKAHGVEPVDIKEKFFQYSCRVGEFKQIFDNNPDEASVYATKFMLNHYSAKDVQLFVNSFRLIRELDRYCHSDSINKEELMNKLHLLYTNFEEVPDIANERINPLLHDGIRELELIRNMENFKSRCILLCDLLIELLNIEVMSANLGKKGCIAAQKENIPFSGTGYVNEDDNELGQDGHTAGKGNNECSLCHNVIDQSNKQLTCQECNAYFCHTCESSFREKRKLRDPPLCEKCFTAEQQKLAGERIEIIEEDIEAFDFDDDESIEVIVVKTWESEPAEETSEDEFTEFTDEEGFESKREDERLQKEREKQELLRKAQEDEEQKRHEQEVQERCRKDEELKAQEAARRKAAEEAERKRKEEERLRREREEAAKKPSSSIKNSIGMEFVLIPAGEFQMGSNESNNEQSVHKVRVSKPFYLGKYPVTQKEWQAVMGTYPSHFKDDNNPVEKVSWNDVQEFVKKLNAKEGTDKYRLPFEAEWEYACRAGTTTKYSFGDDESKLGEYAWYYANSKDGSLFAKRKTRPVGQKKPNPWGLYDMHGNVWEWCKGRRHNSYNGAPTDGSAWIDVISSIRVSRGGGWYSDAMDCRSADRRYDDPDFRCFYLGFRLLRAV